jgi:hypothetical protein
VVLEREVELEPVRIRFREWPGYAGPVVHVAEGESDSDLVSGLADRLAPRYRVLSIAPSARGRAVHAAHVAELLDLFGFSAPLVIGGPVAALVAEQHPIAGLVVTDAAAETRAQPSLRSTSIDEIEAFIARTTPCQPSA